MLAAARKFPQKPGEVYLPHPPHPEVLKAWREEKERREKEKENPKSPATLTTPEKGEATKEEKKESPKPDPKDKKPSGVKKQKCERRPASGDIDDAHIPLALGKIKTPKRESV